MIAFSLRTKLALMVLVPAIGILSLAYPEVRGAMDARNETRSLQSLVDLSVRSSAMVHELQKERGMSAGFLGSRGANFADALPAQRLNTDEKIAALTDFLRGFESQRFGEEFGATLGTGLAQLEQLAAVRDRISELSISTSEGIGFYTATNRAFLQLVEHLPKLSSDGALSINGTAYAAFLQSKERAGIERAVLANTFARDNFAPGFYQRFVNLVNVQNVYLDVFIASAGKSNRESLATLLKSDPVIETQRMRDIAIERSTTGGFGVDPAVWFDQQTQKINLLKSLENQLADGLTTMTQTGLRRATEQLRTTLIAAGVPLAAAVILGFLFSVLTLRKLGADPTVLEGVVSAIANNQLDIDLSRDKPATGVFASAQIMQKNLRERIEADQKLLAENGRIRKALTTVDGNVLIAGADNSIIYANDAMTRFFEKVVNSCAKAQSPLAIQELLGADVDRLHQNPDAPPPKFAAMHQQTSGRLQLGAFTIDYVASPVTSDEGERIGSVFEWTDRTDELIEQRQVQATLAENGRIRQALTNVSGNVMIADLAQQVVYANAAMKRLLSNIGHEIQQVVPETDTSNIIDADVDRLHLKSHGEQSFFSKLDQQFEGRLEFGSVTVDYVANPVFGIEGDRIGTVFEWTDRTADLAEEIEIQAQLAENGRIRQALTNAAGNVMIADTDGSVVYANKAMKQFFAKVNAAVRQAIPEITTNEIAGVSIDALHKLSQTQKFTTLTAPEEGQVQFGGYSIDYFANPVSNDSGERLGTFVEWADRTTELAVKSEVEGVVNAALSGDLTRRIVTDDHGGFYATLANSVNQLVDIAERVVEDTMRVFAAVASGDLSETIDADYVGAFDQLKTDANKTIHKLTEVVGEIQCASASVQTAANEIAQGNLDLSQRTESQSASLEETASSMTSMTDTVQRNAENAQAANALARSAKEQAERGGAVVSQAVTAMREINESSKKIADIISVIDEIAFQTNLLALNASVEAARAGDQGRGFAVVASEVGNLAGRSATAAKEIKELIEDSTRKVHNGTELVEQSGGTLQEIVEGVQKVTKVVADIAVASQEQSTDIGEVNRSVAQMDTFTQQNSALVDKAATASSQLSDQTDRLNGLMQFFSVAAASRESARDTVRPLHSNTPRTAGNAALDYITEES